MSDCDICKYVQKQITCTHKELQSDSFWLGLRDNLCKMLGLQTNFYKQELYENKIRIDYAVDIIYTQTIQKPHYTTQKILIIGDSRNSTDSFHFQDEIFNSNNVSDVAAVIFFYPEFGKFLVFLPLNHHNLEFILAQINWNWFYTMKCSIETVDTTRRQMHLTLTTGTSAMPNGICNVFIPRFEYAFRQKKTKRIDIANTNYPIDHNLYMTFEEILVSALTEYHDYTFMNSSPQKIELGSIHELIGLDQSRIQKKGNQIFHSVLIRSICDIIRKKHPYWCFDMSYDTFQLIFACLPEAPNILTFEAILELDCCMRCCVIPYDIISVLLRAIGRVLW